MSRPSDSQTAPCLNAGLLDGAEMVRPVMADVRDAAEPPRCFAAPNGVAVDDRLLDALTHAEFQAVLPSLLARHPQARNCTRTRLHDGAPLPLREQALAALALPARGHRCHVAQAWAKRFDALSVPLAQVLVSGGVRQSLGWLMGAWASQGRRMALPADVYPVYGQLAAENLLPFEAYPLHPKLQTTHWDTADVLLVTNPVKPRGDALGRDEVAEIRHWLAQDSRRRVVVDAVYDFEPALQPGTQALWATGQAVVLHSLSKIWLSPWVAGVALVPAADAAALTAVFRAHAGDGQRLAQAEAWLQQRPDFPQAVAQAFEQAREALAQQLRAAGLMPLPTQGPAVSGYLLPVACSVGQAAQAGFVGLPASVFGAASAAQPVTVFSALDALSHPAGVQPPCPTAPLTPLPAQLE